MIDEVPGAAAQYSEPTFSPHPVSFTGRSNVQEGCRFEYRTWHRQKRDSGLRDSFLHLPQHHSPVPMFPFSPRLVLIATLAVMVGVACPLPQPVSSTNQSASEASSLQSTPTLQSSPATHARLGMLPDVGGISLDLLLLGLIGAGYAMARLHREDPAYVPGKSDERSIQPQNAATESRRSSPVPSNSC